jgi:hypothetical protein
MKSLRNLCLAQVSQTRPRDEGRQVLLPYSTLDKAQLKPGQGRARPDQVTAEVKAAAQWFRESAVERAMP